MLLCSDLGVGLSLRPVVAHRVILRSIRANQEAIEEIRSVALRRGFEITVAIVSDGEKDDFMDFFHLGVSFRLHGDPLEDFISLQNSDVLLIAKSSFSYLAGVLHLGKCVIYEPWHYPPLDSWVQVDVIEGPLLGLL